MVIGSVGSLRMVLTLLFVVAGSATSLTACASASHSIDRFRIGDCPTDTPVGEPVFAYANKVDSSLVSMKRGQLIVLAFGTAVIEGQRHPLYDARIRIKGANGAGTDTTSRSGVAVFEGAAGAYTVHVQGSTYRDWSGNVAIRTGRSDTLQVYPGRHVACLFRAR